MVSLNDTALWAKMDSPYGEADAVPALIEKLQQTQDPELLDEICWEHIYHQNSLYEVTFATVPYLIELCEQAIDDNFRVRAYLNLGVILCELDGEDDLLKATYADSQLDEAAIKSILDSYNAAFPRLKGIGATLLDAIKNETEDGKRYFLIGLAAANRNFKVGRVFAVFSSNEEYMCSCPACDNEFYLWPKEDKLVLYVDDPVSHKEQAGYDITPFPAANIQPTATVSWETNIHWLTYYINALKIESLRPIINHLFGTVTCPVCKEQIDVFEGVTGPL
jgi:hypothetical protein